MFDEGDPVATRLLEEYRVAMPDLGLTGEEAEEILEYLAAASDAATVRRRGERLPGDRN